MTHLDYMSCLLCVFRVPSDPSIYAMFSQVLSDPSIYSLFLLFLNAFHFLSTSCHMYFKLTISTRPHHPDVSCILQCLPFIFIHYLETSFTNIHTNTFIIFFMFYFTDSTNCLPNVRTVPCVILGSPPTSGPLLAQSAICGVHICPTFSTATAFYVCCRLHISCARFSHNRFFFGGGACISSSPVTFPAVASLQSHFLQSFIAGLGWV